MRNRILVLVIVIGLYLLSYFEVGRGKKKSPYSVAQARAKVQLDTPTQYKEQIRAFPKDCIKQVSYVLTGIIFKSHSHIPTKK